jgi:GNAT superfamily N-acetyltransferase
VTQPIVIRPYLPVDLPQVRALNARVQPYRPEDEGEVAAMHARAEEAQRTGDRWSPRFASTDTLDEVEGSYAAFWVAAMSAEIVGIIGVRIGVPPKEAAAARREGEWLGRTDIADLRRLRVAPEAQRVGIGARLTQTVIDWARQHQMRAVMLNTTAAQTPARALYENCGFVEVSRAFLGEYEFVWYELTLREQPD